MKWEKGCEFLCVEVFMERLWKKMKHGMQLCVANNRGEAFGLLV